MNGNYSWQNQQVNERIQTRINEAESHRSLNRSNNRASENPSHTVGGILFMPVTAVAALIRRIGTLDRSNRPHVNQNI